ncbi:uncharacterized protein LOC128989076 [Macrosteles quadrilineatus]|uniref:uncharacterized protein LOC128989076 n=1 Tax=Macrosteles quadrilineatus TaxID=74068 RepID=UPI0023E1B4E6|nr:uncharacterized protein LOC128989076 [Macrosteles quadrilineatus]
MAEEELLSKLKAELEKSRKRLNEFEAENNVLKEQKLTLTTGVKEERNRNSILEQKMNSLQQALNEAYKKEKLAQEEVRVSQERMEVARTELRALYQGQLEAVVKEKLQEFQTQLETAEAALKAELHNKEKHWAEKANDQCRQLHDKFKRDLLRVEEIHKADINSWKEKLTESERLRTALEKKLQEEADRRADIAQRLHSVMETQWREALNIISNPIKALYEAPQEDRSRCQGQGDVRVSRSASTASLGPGEDVPFCQEGMVTYRTSQPSQDQQLKKYIQMLLDRGPGNPVPLQNVAQQDNLEPQTFATRDNGLLDRWIMENEKQTKEQSDRQNQFNKPPWR